MLSAVRCTAPTALSFNLFCIKFVSQICFVRSFDALVVDVAASASAVLRADDVAASADAVVAADVVFVNVDAVALKTNPTIFLIDRRSIFRYCFSLWFYYPCLLIYHVSLLIFSINVELKCNFVLCFSLPT